MNLKEKRLTHTQNCQQRNVQAQWSFFGVCIGYQRHKVKNDHWTLTHCWSRCLWRLYHRMMCWIWVTKSKIIIEHLPRFLRVRVVAPLPVFVVDDHVVLVVATVHYWLCVTKSKIIIKYLLTFPPCPCGCCTLSCWTYVYGTNFGGGLENQRLGEKIDGLDLNICVGYPLQNPKKIIHGTFTHPSGWWPNRRWRCLYHSMMCWIWVTKSKIIIKHLLTFPPCLCGCSVSSGWWLFYVGQSRKYSLKIFTFLRRGSSLTGSSFCCVGYQRQSQKWSLNIFSLLVVPVSIIEHFLSVGYPWQS